MDLRKEGGPIWVKIKGGVNLCYTMTNDEYRKITNISPGLIDIFKHILGGLYLGRAYPKTINFCDINLCDINFCEFGRNSQKLMSQKRVEISHSQKLMSQKIFKLKKVSDDE